MNLFGLILVVANQVLLSRPNLLATLVSLYGKREPLDSFGSLLVHFLIVVVLESGKGLLPMLQALMVVLDRL